MRQIAPKVAIELMNKNFERWGMPRKIKIDNGRPFVNMRHRDTPTLAILWWIGLGIEVIQNNPASPQENGAVENLQATLARWSHPKTHTRIEDFQKALDEAGRIQREVYMVSAKGYKSRISLFPELKTNTRVFSYECFDFQRVEQYLSERVWRRKVRHNGRIRFMGKEFHMGRPYAGKEVSISFDPIEQLWLIHDADGALLNQSKREIVSKREILDFASR